MAQIAKPKSWLTCHVLDTTTGKPAVGLAVRLVGHQDSGRRYAAQTNQDGRINDWQANDEIPLQSRPEEGQWTLTFDTEAYFGAGNTLWPQVTITIATKASESHYHVPLLLSPWSYTTYRGS